jgi:hypothetical protein
MSKSGWGRPAEAVSEAAQWRFESPSPTTTHITGGAGSAGNDGHAGSHDNDNADDVDDEGDGDGDGDDSPSGRRPSNLQNRRRRPTKAGDEVAGKTEYSIKQRNARKEKVIAWGTRVVSVHWMAALRHWQSTCTIFLAAHIVHPQNLVLFVPYGLFIRISAARVFSCIYLLAGCTTS